MAGQADGSIVINTELDNKKAQAELTKLAKTIDEIERDLDKSRGSQNSIKAELDVAKEAALETEQVIKSLKAELQEVGLIASGQSEATPLEYLTAIERKKELTEQLSEQEAILADQDKEAQRLDAQYAKITDKVQEQVAKLEDCKEQAGELSLELAGVGENTDLVSTAMNEVSKRLDKFTNRIQKLAARVFIFTMITTALRSMRTWMGNVIKTNNEATVAIAKLKGALLTLAQPLVNVIIPAFTAFVNVITQVVTAIASLLSSLFGTTVEQSAEAAEALDAEANAIGETGSAAKKAGKSLAAFDTINKLSSTADSSNSGEDTSGIPADFSLETSDIESALDRILAIAKLIAAALLSWKLSDSLAGGVKTFIGLIIAFTGAVELAKAMWDAWQNGLNWDNLKQMLTGALLLVSGLGLAFGTTGAAVGLLVSGLALLITGFHDAMENGWGLQSALAAIAGLIGTGLAISLLTGTWIPLLIAGIGAALLALTIATGNGEELLDGLKAMLQGFLDFFEGIFTGNLELTIQGIGEIFQGLKGIVLSVVHGLRDSINSFLDWLDEKTQGKLTWLIDWVKEFLNGAISAIEDTLSGFIDAAQQIFKGIIEFLTGVFTNDWDLAWEGIKDVVKGAVNGLISLLEGGLNFVINAINSFINAINGILSMIGDAFELDAPSIPTIPAISLPRLAAGAVIPPNREFLAVLGDQTSGTNIEAPLDTIVEAVMLALQKSGMSGNNGSQTVIDNALYLDGEVIYRNQKKVSKRHGASLVKG